MHMDTGRLKMGTGFNFTSGYAIVEKAIAALPFARSVMLMEVEARLLEINDYAVCVPVQNEERFLPRSLVSLLTATTGCDAFGTIVLLVNNSSDASLQTSADVLRASGCSYLVANVALDHGCANAPHARRIALDIGASLASNGTLLTTDADTLVASDWVTSNLCHVRANSDLVCGSVSIAPAEYAALPRSVRLCGEAETQYSALLERKWQSWTVPSAPSFQLAAMGASLALPTARYKEIGGMPIPLVAEDKAVAALGRARGWSITMASDVRVETSARLHARAAGGMGDALLARVTDDDPYCDEQLVPLDLLRRIADVWNGLPAGFDRSARLQDNIARNPTLQHNRMRLSEVLAQLVAEADEKIETSGDYTRSSVHA